MNDRLSALLDNVTWNALSGPQAGFSAGTERVRRYAAGFSPIVGFADRAAPDLAALARFCEPGEHFYCDGWTGTPPAGWTVDVESTMFRMVWDGALPDRDEAPDALPIGLEQAEQAQQIAALTQPGPFGPRTILNPTSWNRTAARSSIASPDPGSIGIGVPVPSSVVTSRSAPSRSDSENWSSRCPGARPDQIDLCSDIW